MFKGFRTPARFALLLLSVIVCASNAPATTTGDYHQRIRDAASALEQLTLTYDDENSSQRARRIASTIQLVRAELPVREAIILNGIRVQIDNAWLDEALREYERVDDADPRRAEALAGIAERLQALDERLAEIESGKVETRASRDENKARLAEILRRPEYNQRAEQSSALGRLLQRFLRWLESLIPEMKPLQPGRAAVFSRVAQILVIAFAVAVIAYVVWKFGSRLVRQRRGKKREKRVARIVLGERLEPDQTAADLLSQAEALAHTGDLRAAIRKAYIALLCELGDRKIISLAQHRTNRDYLHAVRDLAPLHRVMRRLTDSFEQHWYGFAPAAPDDWSNFRAGYQEAIGSA